MKMQDILSQFGLDQKKSAVYLAVLELGGATVLEIAKKAQQKRTSCYDTLFALLDDGFILETIVGKKRHFIAEDPEKIHRLLKSKERLFSEILPQLKSIHNTKTIKPKIRFYEGKEGLKEVYEDTLRYNSEVLAFASDDVMKVLGMEWSTAWLRKRIKKGIWAKAIIPGTKFMTDNFLSRDTQQLRLTKIIDPDKYPFSIEINIYGNNKVALISSREEMGIIIEGQEIYNTLKFIFQLTWNLLPDIKSK